MLNVASPKRQRLTPTPGEQAYTDSCPVSQTFIVSTEKNESVAMEKEKVVAEVNVHDDQQESQVALLRRQVTILPPNRTKLYLPCRRSMI